MTPREHRSPRAPAAHAATPRRAAALHLPPQGHEGEASVRAA
jgi:hypothetical protein